MSEDTDILIVGAGFSGLGTAIRLRQEGYTDFVVVERGDDVGGTWHFNTYPNCGCDVPSHLYSFSFAPNADWSRTYSKQPEIRDYLQRTADQFGVRPHVRTNTTVLSAEWDEEAGRWNVETDAGSYRARMLVPGMGPLAEPRIPEIEGLEDFQGEVMHSARWDHSVDLKGKKVASIGTGASAIQYVPAIQPDVEQLHVFQRTAPWIMPHTDRPTKAWERRIYGAFPALEKVVRGGVYAARELLVVGFVKQPKLMGLVEKIARKHIQQSVPDPELRAKVTPDYTIGCKRILPSNRWYPALAEDNVELVTDGVVKATATGVVDAAGVEREADVIVFGTGFQVTDMPVGKAVTRPRRQDHGRGVAGKPERLPGHLDPRLPQPVHAARPQHRPGPQLDDLHDRVPDRARDRRAGRDAPPRRRHRRGARGRGARVQRRDRQAPRGRGVEHRLRLLVPGRHRPQRHAVARLDVPVPPAHGQVRAEQVRADHAHRARARAGGGMTASG